MEAKFFLHLALCELEMLQFALKTLRRLTGDSRSSAERLLCPRQRTAEHSRLAGQPIHPALQPSRDRGGGRASSRQVMEELFVGAGSSWISSSLLEELLDLAGGGAAGADAALDRFAFFFFGGVSSRRSSAGKALSRRRRCAR